MCLACRVDTKQKCQTQESETIGHVRGQLGQMAVESCGGQSEWGEGAQNSCWNR